MNIEEIWELKDELELKDNSYVFNFTSNNIIFAGIIVTGNTLTYLDEELQESLSPYVNGTWVLPQYKTLEIDTVIESNKTIKFLVDNKKTNNELLIVLYKNKGESIVVDKDINLYAQSYVKGNFLNTINISNIVVQFSSDKLLNFNYVYIPVLHRFYFLTTFNIVNNKIYQLELKEDVLYTYKDIILEQEAYISRSEDDTIIDKYLIDSEQLSLNKNTYERIEITDGDDIISSDTDSPKHFLVQVV